MGRPYNIDGEFLVVAHIRDSPYNLSGEPDAPTQGESVIVLPEKLWIEFGTNHAWQYRVSNLIERIAFEPEVIDCIGADYRVAIFPAKTSMDLWNGLGELERRAQIPATAIPRPFDTWDDFDEEYPGIQSELHQVGGDISSTGAYAFLLSEALHKLNNAPDFPRRFEAWRELRRYFPVPRFVRDSMPHILSKPDGRNSTEYHDLISQLKLHASAR